MAVSMIVAAIAAAGVFWLGYDGGAYSLASRTTAAIAVLWALGAGVVAGVLPAGRLPRSAVALGIPLAALAALTLASATWAPSAERAYGEFVRVVLYLAVFALAALAVRRATAARFADGVAIGISGICVLALANRFFPGLVSTGDVETLLPTAHARLSYPLDYWNGLGVLAALAVPLLLRAAAAERSPVARGLAVLPLPAVAAVIFLASSRGGAAVAVVGGTVLVAGARRWSAAAAALVAGAASALAVALIERWPSVVNPSRSEPVIAADGRAAALAVAATCIAAAIVFAAGCRLVPASAAPSRAAAAVFAGIALFAAGTAAVAAHPVRQFDAFRQPPPPPSSIKEEFVQTHLFSTNGNGRWQFWSAAIDEFRSRPLAGRGAGSFEPWWAQQGTLPNFVRDAHSLYLEQLGELGILGFALVAAIVLGGVGLGVQRVRAADDVARPAAAALLGAFCGFAVAAGVDWMWEMTVVSAVGFACLGVLAAMGTAARPRQTGRAFGVPVRAAVVVVVLGLIVAQAIPLLADVKLRASQAAARGDDTRRARSDALGARDLAPWAATPYLQLALVEEQAGRIRPAREWIGEAIARDSLDWRLWLVRARLETEAGAIAAARRSLARARVLNPRSPLFRRHRA